MATWRPFAVLALLLASAPARAEEHGEKKEHGEGEAKPADDAGLSGPTDRYVHKWTPFPALTGAALPAADGQRTIAPEPGKLTIVVFLASWCEPCQQLTPRLRDLEKRYQRLPVSFHYVFLHDTLEDAGGFMKEFGIARGVLGNTEILKTYHNPDLPTVYVGDRHGWLMKRYVKAGPESVDDLNELLKYLAAY